MSSTEIDLQEAQEDIESYIFKEVDLLESLSSQEESFSPIEPLSLSDVKLIEPFDLQEQFILEKYKEDLAHSSKPDKANNISYSLETPEVSYQQIKRPADLVDVNSELQDPLSINSDPPSPKDDAPDSLEWDPLVEPPILSLEDVRDSVIIQKDIENLSNFKAGDSLDTHGFEWDHIDESITLLHDGKIQQPISLQQTQIEQSNIIDDNHGSLSLPEYNSGRYSPSLDLRKFTLDLNDDDNGPREYYGPQISYTESHSSLNTSMRPKIVHKSNKLKKYDHYLVEFDDDEVVVQKCNTLNNSEESADSPQMQKKKTEKKRRGLSRKAKMYIQSENLKRAENDIACEETKLMSKNTIPEIVDISKSSNDPKKTKVMIKGLDNMNKSDIEGVLGHLNNYITDNAISTALNEHTYFTKKRPLSPKDISNLSYSDIQLNILKQTLLQAGLLSLNEVLDQGVLDITNRATVQLGQILTFSLYFNKNIREISKAAWRSQPVACLTDTVQDIAHEVTPSLTLGTCLVALSDQTDGSSLDETWVGLGCLALTYLYQVARKTQKVKESNHKTQKVKESNHTVKK